MELEKKNRIWKLKGDSKQPQLYRTEDPFTTFSEHYSVQVFSSLYRKLISNSISMQVLNTLLPLRTLLVISLCILSVCTLLNMTAGEGRTQGREVIPVSTEETPDVQHWVMLPNLAYFLLQIKDIDHA